MVKKISYLIPDSDFASEDGQGGQVTHAKGILDGLVQNGIDVKLYGEPNIVRFIDSQNLKVIKPVNSFPLDFYYSYRMLKSAIHNEVDFYLIRKSVGVLIISILTLNFRMLGIKDKVVWEVNGLSLHNYRNGRIGKIFYWLSIIIHKVGLRNNKGIYVVTDFLKEELSEGTLSLKKNKIKVISNGGPGWQGVKSSNSIIRFIYFGVFQPYNDFKTIIDAFIDLKNEIDTHEIELHFCGYGVQEELITHYSIKRNDVFYWGPKNINQLYEEHIANERSIGIIPMSDDSSKLRSPIKMYDYLSLGMPILGTDKLSHNIQSKSDLLFHFYENKNVKSCKAAMSKFTDSNFNWDEVKNMARKSSKDNSWSSRMRDLLKFINVQ